MELEESNGYTQITVPKTRKQTNKKPNKQKPYPFIFSEIREYMAPMRQQLDAIKNKVSESKKEHLEIKNMLAEIKNSRKG